MKKSLTVAFVVMLTIMLLLSACAVEEPEEKDPYITLKPSDRETTVPYNQLLPGRRIVFLQTSFIFPREDSYGFQDEKPDPEEIEYKGSTVEAYSIKHTLKFLYKTKWTDMTVHNGDGSTQEFNSSEFDGLYYIADFNATTPAVLYNPETGTEINDFLFAVSNEGEAIYSVVNGSSHDADEMISNVGWDIEIVYRYVATGQHYVTVYPDELLTGEINGTSTGTINGSFPDMPVFDGKVENVLVIEIDQ